MGNVFVIKFKEKLSLALVSTSKWIKNNADLFVKMTRVI